MALRERLDYWREPVGLESSLDLVELPVAALDVQRRLGTPIAEIPSDDILARVVRQLTDAFHRGSLSEIPKRLLKYVPWALFHSSALDEPPLLENPRLFHATLDMLRQRGTARTGLALAQCYLRHYNHYGTDSELLEQMRLAARRLLKRSAYPKAVRFLQLSRKFGFLEGKGHPHFVEAFFEADKPPEILLADAGLVGDLGMHGFIEHAFAHLCDRVRRLLAGRKLTPEQLNRCLNLAVITEGSATRLRFGPERSARFLESLLEPFRNQEPDEGIQNSIKGFALRWYGDPRLKPHNWSAVSTEALSVMRRWLVAATLEAFFQILDENADRYEDADRQWPYRRAFWTAYLRADHIIDAWVALGWRVATDSRLQLKEVAANNYGELKGSRPDHAVLILRVADLIITEWSHMGKYRAWQADSASAPKLYKSLYHRRELLHMPDFEGTHHGAENGRWQRDLSDHIRRRTGIKMGLRELMP